MKILERCTQDIVSTARRADALTLASDGEFVGHAVRAAQLLVVSQPLWYLSSFNDDRCLCVPVVERHAQRALRSTTI